MNVGNSTAYGTQYSSLVLLREGTVASQRSEIIQGKHFCFRNVIVNSKHMAHNIHPWFSYGRVL